MFVTGTHSEAATDAEMYVKLQGTDGDHTFYFDGSGGVFSVGGTDTFERDGPSVGTLGEDIFEHFYPFQSCLSVC